MTVPVRYNGLRVWNRSGLVVIAKTKKRALELLGIGYTIGYLNDYFSECANDAMERLVPQGEGLYRERGQWTDIYDRVKP